MKIIRWFLSHIFLFLFIVIVIYGYMFWGNLAGEDTPVGKVITYLSDEFVEVDEFVNAIKAKQADVAEGPQDEKREASTGSEADKVASDTSRNIQQDPVSISYSDNQRRVDQNSTGEIRLQASNTAEPVLTKQQSNSSEIQAKSAVAEQVEAQAPDEGVAFVSADIEQQLDNVDEHGRIVDAASQSAEVRALWIAARKAYYQRDYRTSEMNYMQVIDNTNDNFDAYGELGNVYFNQGKRTQAAAAYYEAAAIFVHRGEITRARSLMGLLRNLDKAKAEDLQKMIDSAKS